MDSFMFLFLFIGSVCHSEVLVPLSFDPNNPTVVHSWEGKTRNITCTALGEPQPQIQWYHNDALIDQRNETFQVYSEGRESNLEISVFYGNERWVFGQYICRATNVNEQKELAIQLRRARVPDEPGSVEVVDSSPTMVELSVQPPLENGGVEVYGFRVETANSIQEYSIDPNHTGKNRSETIRIENLKPATMYIFGIRAKNEVGVSNAVEFSHQTKFIRQPYPISIISDLESPYTDSYDIRWETPKTGGLPINEYRFKYRRVLVHRDTFDLEKPLEDFKILRVDDNPRAPMKSYTLEGLRPRSYYELEVLAFNDIGSSVARPFIFKTKEGDGSGSAVMETSLRATLMMCILAILL